jgi:hypothetical protein
MVRYQARYKKFSKIADSGVFMVSVPMVIGKPTPIPTYRGLFIIEWK